ncbi:hypothetical protein PM082_012414 [Marasmius tenuissimus]|nr:hypothetical protein PM082_012414 [Marasmius tenuissimus]
MWAGYKGTSTGSKSNILPNGQQVQRDDLVNRPVVRSKIWFHVSATRTMYIHLFAPVVEGQVSNGKSLQYIYREYQSEDAETFLAASKTHIYSEALKECTDQQLITMCKMRGMTVTRAVGTAANTDTTSSSSSRVRLGKKATKGDNRIQKIILKRAEDEGIALPRLLWKTLARKCVEQGIQLFNYPIGVLEPWQTKTAMRQGVKNLPEEMQQALIDQCAEGAEHRFSFRRADHEDLECDRIPLLVYAPDKNGVRAEVPASEALKVDSNRTKTPAVRRKRGIAKAGPNDVGAPPSSQQSAASHTWTRVTRTSRKKARASVGDGNEDTNLTDLVQNDNLDAPEPSGKRKTATSDGPNVANKRSRKEAPPQRGSPITPVMKGEPPSLESSEGMHILLTSRRPLFKFMLQGVTMAMERGGTSKGNAATLMKHMSSDLEEQSRGGAGPSMSVLLVGFTDHKRLPRIQSNLRPISGTEFLQDNFELIPEARTSIVPQHNRAPATLDAPRLIPRAFTRAAGSSSATTPGASQSVMAKTVPKPATAIDSTMNVPCAPRAKSSNQVNPTRTLSVKSSTKTVVQTPALVISSAKFARGGFRPLTFLSETPSSSVSASGEAV